MEKQKVVDNIFPVDRRNSMPENEMLIKRYKYQY